MSIWLIYKLRESEPAGPKILPREGNMAPITPDVPWAIDDTAVWWADHLCNNYPSIHRAVAADFATIGREVPEELRTAEAPKTEVKEPTLADLLPPVAEAPAAAEGGDTGAKNKS